MVYVYAVFGSLSMYRSVDTIVCENTSVFLRQYEDDDDPLDRRRLRCDKEISIVYGLILIKIKILYVS